MFTNWLADEKGLTPATWFLGLVTCCLVVTGIGAISFARRQLLFEVSQRRLENLNKAVDDFYDDRRRYLRKKFATGRLDGDRLVRKQDSGFPDCAMDILDFFDHVASLTRKGHVEA